ncbi:UNVERIFIED_CONTAM: hypothetical protein K2H54_020116 [Gekko kuhli]
MEDRSNFLKTLAELAVSLSGFGLGLSMALVFQNSGVWPSASEHVQECRFLRRELTCVLQNRLKDEELLTVFTLPGLRMPNPLSYGQGFTKLYRILYPKGYHLFTEFIKNRACFSILSGPQSRLRQSLKATKPQFKKKETKPYSTKKNIKHEDLTRNRITQKKKKKKVIPRCI